MEYLIQPGPSSSGPSPAGPSSSGPNPAGPNLGRPSLSPLFMSTTTTVNAATTFKPTHTSTTTPSLDSGKDDANTYHSAIQDPQDLCSPNTWAHPAHPQCSDINSSYSSVQYVYKPNGKLGVYTARYRLSLANLLNSRLNPYAPPFTPASKTLSSSRWDYEVDPTSKNLRLPVRYIPHHRKARKARPVSKATPPPELTMKFKPHNECRPS